MKALIKVGLLLSGIVFTALLQSCGSGTPGPVVGSQASQVAGRVVLTIHVLSGTASRHASATRQAAGGVPEGARALRVQVTDPTSGASLAADQVVGVSAQGSATVTVSNIRAGAVRVRVTAHPDAAALQPAIGIGQADTTVPAGGTAQVTVNVLPTADHLSVTPPSADLAISDPASPPSTTFTASVFDSSNTALTGYPLVWSSSNSIVASVRTDPADTTNSTAIVQGLQAGTATIEVREPNSGKTAQATVNVTATGIVTLIRQATSPGHAETASSGPIPEGPAPAPLVTASSNNVNGSGAVSLTVTGGQSGEQLSHILVGVQGHPGFFDFTVNGATTAQVVVFLSQALTNQQLGLTVVTIDTNGRVSQPSNVNVSVGTAGGVPSQGVTQVLLSAVTTEGFAGAVVPDATLPTGPISPPTLNSRSFQAAPGGSIDLRVGAALPLTNVLVGIEGQGGYFNIDVSNVGAQSRSRGRQFGGLLPGYQLNVEVAPGTQAGQYTMDVVVEDANGNLSQPTSATLTVTP